MALVWGMSAPGEEVSFFDKVAFAVPLVLFAVSIWISGYLFREYKILSAISTCIAAIIVLANIYAVVFE